MVRLYLSLPCVWMVTSFPKARAEEAYLAFLLAVDAAPTRHALQETKGSTRFISFLSVQILRHSQKF
jgi:hypothetical protein